MTQYREIKARHQSAILFFRMGDFYEMFYEDAETAARVLGLTLTSRNNGGAAFFQPPSIRDVTSCVRAGSTSPTMTAVSAPGAKRSR